MEFNEIMVPAVSALGGGAIVGLVLKIIVQAWFRKHEFMETALQEIKVQLARIEERMKGLQHYDEISRSQDRAIAVLQTRTSEFGEDLNGLGRKLRAMEQS